MTDNALTFKLPEDVTNARQNAQNLTGVAQQYQGTPEVSVTEALRQAVTNAYANNQDIVGPLDIATQKYFQAPSEARLKYGQPGTESYLASPQLRENLISQYVGNQAIPMLSLANVLGNRFGRISDLINSGVGGYTATTNAAVAKATNARTLYEDLLNEYTKKQAAELDIYKALHPSGGSGVNINLGGLDLSGLNQGQAQTQPTESEPYYSPIQGEGTTSPQGQWVFHSGEWMINTEA